MKFSEKEMEDCIWDNPSDLIGEEGLVSIERQVNLDGYRADLMLRDSNGDYLLVEIQKGGLDRTHIWKILDYGFRLKKINGHKNIRLMVIANVIRKKQIETLNHLRVEYREISKSKLSMNSSEVSKTLDIERDETSFNVKEFQASVFDRGIDGRYFGFSGNRAMAASLYARNEGASQEEVNVFMSELTNQKGFYNMLDQANNWGHEVAFWDDTSRGKVFKLIYNLSHSARTTIDPPKNWVELNKCVTPEGMKVGRYVRNSR